MSGMPPHTFVGSRYMTGAFMQDGSPLASGPRWGMSLMAAGSMRFRWNERNPVRDAFLASITGGAVRVAPVELVHSHTVYAVGRAEELAGRQGDGIITRSRSLMPVVTVADCMPLFLYEPVAGVFGALHSGWKGTGIVRAAVELAERQYGARRERFCVVMGPHIHSCCYIVDEGRAAYFQKNFTPRCVERAGRPEEGRYRLSLALANRAVLDSLGVPDGNIAVCGECTGCDARFGSFRRQTASLPAGVPMEERQRCFTVQAAWVLPEG